MITDGSKIERDINCKQLAVAEPILTSWITSTLLSPLFFEVKSVAGHPVPTDSHKVEKWFDQINIQ
jgi:hypothetical protein